MQDQALGGGQPPSPQPCPTPASLCPAACPLVPPRSAPEGRPLRLPPAPVCSVAEAPVPGPWENKCGGVGEGSLGLAFPPPHSRQGAVVAGVGGACPSVHLRPTHYAPTAGVHAGTPGSGSPQAGLMLDLQVVGL